MITTVTQTEVFQEPESTRIEYIISKSSQVCFNEFNMERANNGIIIYLHAAGMHARKRSWMDRLFPKYGFIEFYNIQDDIWRPDDIYAALNPWRNHKKIMTGFSMGARGTWDYICDHPNDCLGAIPISGFACYLRAAKIKHIAVRAYHGNEDNVVPADEVKKMFHVHKNPKSSLHIIEGGHGMPIEDIFDHSKPWIKSIFN